MHQYGEDNNFSKYHEMLFFDNEIIESWSNHKSVTKEFILLQLPDLPEHDLKGHKRLPLLSNRRSHNINTISF